MHSIVQKIEILFGLNGSKAVSMNKIAQECRLPKKTTLSFLINRKR